MNSLENPFYNHSVIRFEVALEKEILVQTNKYTVHINAIVLDDEEPVKIEIFRTLRTLIDSDWKLDAVHRYQDRTKTALMSVVASTRASEDAGHMLADRAEDLSRVGLQLTIHEIDQNPTLLEIEAVKKELRLEALNLIRQEIHEYNENSVLKYQVGEINHDFSKIKAANEESLSPFHVAKYYSGNSDLAGSVPPAGGSMGAGAGKVASSDKLNIVRKIRLTSHCNAFAIIGGSYV